MPNRWNRRNALRMGAAALWLPVPASLWPGCTPPPSLREELVPLSAPPQRLRTWTTDDEGGLVTRRFAGPAAPQDLIFQTGAGETLSLSSFFPRDNCPFAIDFGLELGVGGFALAVPDRTAAGLGPDDDEPMWALNMVPFGVAIDGVILDPSGPWYDGGPADPDNPFDRSCSGWEYDPIFPTVSDLVGVPSAIRGHVQPGPSGLRGSAGLFHFHGRPAAMLRNLRSFSADPTETTVAGYAADGYWLLDAIATERTSGVELHHFSGYVLADGMRRARAHTDPTQTPPGLADGTYVQDWIYDRDRKRALIEQELREKGRYLSLSAADLASGRARYEILDPRCGRRVEGLAGVDAPSSAFVYVLTEDWPQLPRAFAHEPSLAFRNLIPLAREGRGGRRALYDSCGDDVASVHRWHGREPY